MFTTIWAGNKGWFSPKLFVPPLLHSTTLQRLWGVSGVAFLPDISDDWSLMPGSQLDVLVRDNPGLVDKTQTGEKEKCLFNTSSALHPEEGTRSQLVTWPSFLGSCQSHSYSNGSRKDTSGKAAPASGLSFPVLIGRGCQERRA